MVIIADTCTKQLSFYTHQLNLDYLTEAKINSNLRYLQAQKCVLRINEYKLIKINVYMYTYICMIMYVYKYIDICIQYIQYINRTHSNWPCFMILDTAIWRNTLKYASENITSQPRNSCPVSLWSPLGDFPPCPASLRSSACCATSALAPPVVTARPCVASLRPAYLGMGRGLPFGILKDGNTIFMCRCTHMYTYIKYINMCVMKVSAVYLLYMHMNIESGEM